MSNKCEIIESIEISRWLFFKREKDSKKMKEAAKRE